jgi:hypothetical protein
VPRPKKKLQTFHIVRLKASPAAFIGMVQAEDETTAIKAAVRQLSDSDGRYDRLVL